VIKKRFFRVLLVVIALTLMLTIPVVPVSAAAVIDVDSEEGEIGDEITLTGSGFPVSSELYVFFARQQADVGDEIDAEVTVYSFIGSVVTFFDGRILSFPFNIPTRLDDGPVLADDEDVFGGNYYVYVTYENSETIRAVTSVRVLSNAAITDFSPDEGIVGTEVEISGEGFVPGEAIIGALQTAARRGVAVTLIVPDRVDSVLLRYASRAYTDDLLSAGVRILRFRGGLLHTKSVVIDGETTLFGTVNLDIRSLRLNFEVTMIAYDTRFGHAVRELQLGYASQSEAIDLQRWRQRKRSTRLLENAAQLVSPLL